MRRLQFGQKAFGGPAVAQEKKLQARAFTVFAQNIGVAEQFRNPFDHGQNLIPAHEGVQARAEIRFGRESSGNAQREADFRLSADRARNRGQANVIDFRVGAPYGASGDRDLELARQVVELGIAGQQLRRLMYERRCVDDFVGVYAGDGASGHVADNIAAGSGGVESDLPEAVEDFGQRFDSDPVQLNVLADGEVGDSVGVLAG